MRSAMGRSQSESQTHQEFMQAQMRTSPDARHHSGQPPHGFGGNNEQQPSQPGQAQATPTKRKVFGIGVLLRLQEGNFYVEKMVEGGPAHASGQLNVGDCLIEVDNKACAHKSLNEVLEYIRGPAGSTATLTLFRVPGTSQHIYETVEIVRGDIPRRSGSTPGANGGSLTARGRAATTVHVQPLVHVNSEQIQQAMRDASSIYAANTPRGDNGNGVFMTPRGTHGGDYGGYSTARGGETTGGAPASPWLGQQTPEGGFGPGGGAAVPHSGGGGTGGYAAPGSYQSNGYGTQDTSGPWLAPPPVGGVGGGFSGANDNPGASPMTPRTAAAAGLDVRAVQAALAARAAQEEALTPRGQARLQQQQQQQQHQQPPGYSSDMPTPRGERSFLGDNGSGNNSATNGFAMSGWMYKSKHQGMMARLSVAFRWFAVKGGLLAYFKAPDATTIPINTLNMSKVSRIEVAGRFRGHYGIRLVFPWKTYYVWAPSEEDRAKWRAALVAASQGPAPPPPSGHR